MLTITNPVSSVNILQQAAEEIPLLSYEMSNGEVIVLFAALDLNFGDAGGVALHAARLDVSGNVISGSEFEVYATVNFDAFSPPDQMHIFNDGSLGIFSSNYSESDVLFDRFDLSSGANYGDLIASKTIEYNLPADATINDFYYKVASIDSANDGSAEIIVLFQGSYTQNGSSQFVQGTHAIDINGNGRLLNGIQNSTRILDEAYSGWTKLADGTYVTLGRGYEYNPVTFEFSHSMQIKVIDGANGTASAGYYSRLFDYGKVPGTLNDLTYTEGEQLHELPNGNVLATWFVDSFDDEADGEGIYYAILDPRQGYDNSVVINSTPVVVSEARGISDYYTVEILDDGGFVIAWTATAADIIGPSQAFLQYYTANGAPNGDVIELGSASTDESFAILAKLPNGDVQVSYAEYETTGDTNGYDVKTVTFTPSLQIGAITVKQFGDQSLKDALDGALFSGDISSIGTDKLILAGVDDPLYSAEIAISDMTLDSTLSYGLMGGTVTSISVSYNGDRLFTIDGLEIQAPAFQAAVQQNSGGVGNANLVAALTEHYTIDYDGSRATDSVDNRGDFSYLNDRVIGSAFDDFLAGGDGDDEIIGGQGRDSINGGDGDDVLYGNRGIDFFDPGAGADQIDGGGDFDRVWYGASRSGVTVDLNRGTGSGGDAEGDTYTGIERVTGSSYDDVITGTAVSNAIKGGNGADTIYGLDGRDVIEGQFGDDILYGGNSNDIVLGGDGNDQVYGNRGSDKLDGGFGDDILTGGNDSDYFVFSSDLGQGFGNDIITDFQNGADRLDVRGVHSIADISYTANDLSRFIVEDKATSVKIKFEGGQVIYLDNSNGLVASDIDASDFIFA